jgi:hypothetical protein
MLLADFWDGLVTNMLIGGVIGAVVGLVIGLIRKFSGQGSPPADRAPGTRVGPASVCSICGADLRQEERSASVCGECQRRAVGK